MPVQKWDDETLVVRVADDPVLTEDIGEVTARLDGPARDVVLDLSDLSLLTSSGISRLLRLRKRLREAGRRLILCAPNDQVWGVFLVTGLDKIFEFTKDVATALATVQLAGEAERGP